MGLVVITLAFVGTLVFVIWVWEWEGNRRAALKADLAALKADPAKGVHNLPQVLDDLEDMSEFDLRWLLNETKDLSNLDVHTAAQTRVIHKRIRYLLGEDSGSPTLGQRPTPTSQSTEHQKLPPGYVYLLKMYGVTKVGVTSDIDRRLKEHRRNGWKQVRVWKVRDIETARRIERSCLRAARNLGALLTDEQLRAIMPQGGYTEVTRMTPDHLERLIAEQVNR